MPPRGVRDKPAHGHLTTLIVPFTVIEPFQDGFPPGSFRDVATQKQKSIIAYMLSHAITTIIVFVFDSPLPKPIPYGFPTVSCHAVTSGNPSSLRCINRSRPARKRARCRAACAPDSAQRDTSPSRPLVPRVRGRSLGYLSIFPHEQNKVTPSPARHWATLRHPSSLRRARHAAREKDGRAWRASTKAAMGFRLSMVAGRSTSLIASFRLPAHYAAREPIAAFLLRLPYRHAPPSSFSHGQRACVTALVDRLRGTFERRPLPRTPSGDPLSLLGGLRRPTADAPITVAGLHWGVWPPHAHWS